MSKENKVKTIIIDGVEIQTSLSAVEIADLEIKNKELQKENEELKEINKEHLLLNGELGFKIGTLESEIEEKTKLINSMKKFLLDTRLMSDYLESEGKI